MSWYKAANLSTIFYILRQNCIAQVKVSSFRKVTVKYYFQNKHFIHYILHYLKSTQGATCYLTHEKVFSGHRRCKEQPWFNQGTAQVHTKPKDALLLGRRPSAPLQRGRPGRLQAGGGKQICPWKFPWPLAAPISHPQAGDEPLVTAIDGVGWTLHPPNVR